MEHFRPTIRILWTTTWAPWFTWWCTSGAIGLSIKHMARSCIGPLSWQGKTSGPPFKHIFMEYYKVILLLFSFMMVIFCQCHNFPPILFFLLIYSSIPATHQFTKYISMCDFDYRGGRVEDSFLAVISMHFISWLSFVEEKQTHFITS